MGNEKVESEPQVLFQFVIDTLRMIFFTCLFEARGRDNEAVAKTAQIDVAGYDKTKSTTPIVQH